MKTIGIIGSRRRGSVKDFRIVREAFNAIAEPDDRIVSGGCGTGADHFAESLARDQGRTIIIHYADWRLRGKSAGFARNHKIANDADVLIACVAHDRTGGTEDTITKFLRNHPESDLHLV